MKSDPLARAFTSLTRKRVPADLTITAHDKTLHVMVANLRVR
jgi:hypothetical protein